MRTSAPAKRHRGASCDDVHVFIDLDYPEGGPHWLTPKCPHCGERGCDSECLMTGESPGNDRRRWLREHPQEQEPAQPE